MRKKILIGIIVLVIILIGSFIFLTGGARTDVFLGDYALSADGKTMTLKVGVSSSAGYIRKMKRTSGSMNYYLTFYSTFGINSKLGAKDTFEIELDDNVDEIYFYTGNKGYKLVLVKNPITESFEKVNYSDNGNFKLNLLAKEKITKIGINTYTQNNNYFEFKDQKVINQIYEIFDDLETDVISKNPNPINPSEMYKIEFSDNNNQISTLDIYKKTNKYYAEQSYNGIYEITEEEFNLIKDYIKNPN